MPDKQALRQQILAQIDRCAELAYAAGQHFLEHGKHAPSSMMKKADADAKLIELIEEYAKAHAAHVDPLVQTIGEFSMDGTPLNDGARKIVALLGGNRDSAVPCGVKGMDRKTVLSEGIDDGK